MKPPSEAYRDTRERLTELLRAAGEGIASTSVPSTPGWDVKDVVAHMSGLVVDWLEGRSHDYGSDAWTAAQVEARRDRSLGEVLDEWTERAPELETKMDDPASGGFPDYMPFLAASDATVHEHDIRGALGRPGAQDSIGVELGMKTYITGVRQRHEATDLGPLLIRESDGREWPVGTGDPAATLSASRFDLFRALAGRRSRAQVLGFAWTGDEDAYVDVLIAPGFKWAEIEIDY